MRNLEPFALMAREGTLNHLDQRVMMQCNIPRGEKCVVCGEPLSLGWTIVHGNADCIYCGAPYTVLHYEKQLDGKDKLVSTSPRSDLPEQLIPKLRELWQRVDTWNEFFRQARLICQEEK